VDKINRLVELLPFMLSGAYDPWAAEKLLAERGEFLAALGEDDIIGALTEAADAGYCAVKHLAYVATVLGVSVETILDLAFAKYALRARPGNPKDDKDERSACAAVFARFAKGVQS